MWHADSCPGRTYVVQELHRKAPSVSFPHRFELYSSQGLDGDAETHLNTRITSRNFLLWFALGT